MFETKPLSPARKDFSVQEDTRNGKIKYNFNFDPFVEKKFLIERNERLVRNVIDESLNAGNIFNEIVFFGRAKRAIYESAKLSLENKLGKDLHYFVLSRDTFKKPGVWHMEKMLGAFGPRMTIRLNDVEFSALRKLTGNCFNYKYSDRFDGEVFSKSAYHITVPFSNILSISFIDEFF